MVGRHYLSTLLCGHLYEEPCCYCGASWGSSHCFSAPNSCVFNWGVLFNLALLNWTATRDELLPKNCFAPFATEHFRLGQPRHIPFTLCSLNKNYVLWKNVSHITFCLRFFWTPTLYPAAFSIALHLWVTEHSSSTHCFRTVTSFSPFLRFFFVLVVFFRHHTLFSLLLRPFGFGNIFWGTVRRHIWNVRIAFGSTSTHCA